MLSDLPSSCLHTGMATRRMARLPAQQQSSSAGSLAAFPHEKATAARRHTFNVAIGYTAWGESVLAACQQQSYDLAHSDVKNCSGAAAICCV